MTVKLPPASYAETKASIEARAKKIPADGDTSWDQRRCDAFLEIIRESGLLLVSWWWWWWWRWWRWRQSILRCATHALSRAH